MLKFAAKVGKTLFKGGTRSTRQIAGSSYGWGDAFISSVLGRGSRDINAYSTYRAAMRGSRDFVFGATRSGSVARTAAVDMMGGAYGAWTAEDHRGAAYTDVWDRLRGFGKGAVGAHVGLAAFRAGRLGIQQRAVRSAVMGRFRQQAKAYGTLRSAKLGDTVSRSQVMNARRYMQRVSPAGSSYTRDRMRRSHTITTRGRSVSWKRGVLSTQTYTAYGSKYGNVSGSRPFGTTVRGGTLRTNRQRPSVSARRRGQIKHAQHAEGRGHTKVKMVSRKITHNQHYPISYQNTVMDSTLTSGRPVNPRAVRRRVQAPVHTQKLTPFPGPPLRSAGPPPPVYTSKVHKPGTYR